MILFSDVVTVHAVKKKKEQGSCIHIMWNFEGEKAGDKLGNL